MKLGTKAGKSGMDSWKTKICRRVPVNPGHPGVLKTYYFREEFSNLISNLLLSILFELVNIIALVFLTF